MKHVISCFPNGSIQAVQNDELPLHQMVEGEAQMTRASDVTWDEKLKMWRAVIRPEFRHDEDVEAYEKRHPNPYHRMKCPWIFHNSNRAVAINWEIEYLNSTNRKVQENEN